MRESSKLLQRILLTYIRGGEMERVEKEREERKMYVILSQLFGSNWKEPTVWRTIGKVI